MLETVVASKVTTRKVTNWRVARRESLQSNQEKLQIKVNDQAAHLPVFMHLCDTHTPRNEVHAVRLPRTQKEPRRREASREKGRKETSTLKPLRDGCCDAGLGFFFSAAPLVPCMSDGPDSSQFPEEELSHEHLDALASRSRCRFWRRPCQLEPGGSSAPTTSSRPAAIPGPVFLR